MAIRSVEHFKSKFKTGYVITEQDYADWLDSFRSKLVGVPLSDTTGLDAILEAYRKTADKIPVADIEGLTDFVNELTINFLTTSSEIEQTQIVGLIDALAGFVTAQDVVDMINDAISSVTPTIGSNGNWFVGGEDTGVKAQGGDGQDGKAPVIGSNGNWFVGDEDTGVPAAGQMKTAYNDQIIGVRGEPGSIFTLPEPIYPNSLQLYIDGARQTPGGGKDFVPISDHQFQVLRITTNDETVMIADYIPKR